MTRPLRVVLHAHSTWSYDGTRSLAEVARIYGRLGVDAVMMSEHDTGFDPETFPTYCAECATASRHGALLVPGIEYSSPDNDIHILTWGLDRFHGEHRPVEDILAGVREGGGVAVFAHPVRRAAWRRFDPAWVPDLVGIELWNRKSDGVVWGQEALDLLAQTGLPATVGHDFHKPRHVYPLTQSVPRAQNTGDQAAGHRGGWEAEIIAALRHGLTEPRAFGRPLLHCDGSPGPALHKGAERIRRMLRDLIKGRPA